MDIPRRFGGTYCLPDQIRKEIQGYEQQKSLLEDGGNILHESFANL
jgi:hypothetical protein